VIDAKFSMSFDSYVEFNYILTNSDKGYRRIVENSDAKGLKKILSNSITKMRKIKNPLEKVEVERGNRKKLSKLIIVSPRKLMKDNKISIPNLNLEISNTRVSFINQDTVTYINEKEGLAEQHTIDMNFTNVNENGGNIDSPTRDTLEDSSSPTKFNKEEFLNLKDSPDYSPSSCSSKTSIQSSLAGSPIILRQLPHFDDTKAIVEEFDTNVDGSQTPPRNYKSYKTLVVHSEPNLNKAIRNLTLTDNDDEIEAEMTHIDPNYDKKLGDNFCEAFFISGLPLNDPKVINESVNYTSPCGHEECSLMYGYKPEVLYRLPKRDFKNFELNNTVINFILFLGRLSLFPDGHQNMLRKE
jgi:hypothetical protein